MGASRACINTKFSVLQVRTRKGSGVFAIAFNYDSDDRADADAHFDSDTNPHPDCYGYYPIGRRRDCCRKDICGGGAYDNRSVSGQHTSANRDVFADGDAYSFAYANGDSHALVAGTKEFSFKEAGVFELKGISGDRVLYEVLWRGS